MLLKHNNLLAKHSIAQHSTAQHSKFRLVEQQSDGITALHHSVASQRRITAVRWHHSKRLR